MVKSRLLVTSWVSSPLPSLEAAGRGQVELPTSLPSVGSSRGTLHPPSPTPPRGLAVGTLTSFTVQEIPGLCRALCRERGARLRASLLLLNHAWACPLPSASLLWGPGRLLSCMQGGYLHPGCRVRGRRGLFLFGTRKPFLGPPLLADYPQSRSLPQTRCPRRMGLN